MPKANTHSTTHAARLSDRLDTIELADRLDDIATRLDVVQLAIEGAAAGSVTDLLGPVMTFVGEIRMQVIAVSRDVHPIHAAGGAS